jgi:hypothetical protein
MININLTKSAIEFMLKNNVALEDFIKGNNRHEKTDMGSLRFELKTSAVSRRRHNQLDHEPN